MKKYMIVSLSILGFFILIPTLVYAYGKIPFGGRVTSTKAPGVTCAGQGPITIRSVRGPVGQYAVRTGSRAIYPGRWIIGRYTGAKDSSLCHLDDKNKTPVPVYVIDPNFRTS